VMSAAALPVAVALPVPALAVKPDPTGLDRPAALARMEQVVDLLRTCYVREGWKIDNEAAESALAFMRQFAKDGSEPDDGREATLDFLYSHGQSLDWVLCGDVGGMVCKGADHSERANSLAMAATSHPDAELFAAIERHYAAAAEHERHFRVWEKIEFLKPPPRGWKSKERAYAQSMKAAGKTERAVAAIQARTVDGLIAKANAANCEFFSSEEIKLSIADDVLSMAPSSADMLPIGKAVA
jgi:hypothetical protein